MHSACPSLSVAEPGAHGRHLVRVSVRFRVRARARDPNLTMKSE